MNFNSKNNSQILNSLIAPLNMVNNAAKNMNANINSALNFNSNSSSSFSFPFIPVLIVLVLIGLFIGIFFAFEQQIKDAWNNAKEVIGGYFNPTPTPTPSPTTEQEQPSSTSHLNLAQAAETLEKVLPTSGNEVFGVSSNRFTYYDAEPLCKSLGAELATYEQVKQAWSQGADWCNYGWVKGQMAVYPTSEETYAKLQGGPEDQRMACGKPGVNGGYFDNPEMRFGATCYGKKPSQSAHDAREMNKNAPLSPDALAFDKKVNQFKTEAGSIGVLPFNNNKW